MTTTETTLAGHSHAWPVAIAIEVTDLGALTPTDYAFVIPGESGYHPLASPETLDEAEALVMRVYSTRAASPEERAAAVAGSMFGWTCKAADPANYEVVDGQARMKRTNLPA